MMKGCGWVSLYVVYVYCRLGLEHHGRTEYRKKCVCRRTWGSALVCLTECVVHARTCVTLTEAVTD